MNPCICTRYSGSADGFIPPEPWLSGFLPKEQELRMHRIHGRFQRWRRFFLFCGICLAV